MERGASRTDEIDAKKTAKDASTNLDEKVEDGLLEGKFAFEVEIGGARMGEEGERKVTSASD